MTKSSFPSLRILDGMLELPEDNYLIAHEYDRNANAI